MILKAGYFNGVQNNCGRQCGVLAAGVLYTSSFTQFNTKVVVIALFPLMLYTHTPLAYIKQMLALFQATRPPRCSPFSSPSPSVCVLWAAVRQVSGVVCRKPSTTLTLNSSSATLVLVSKQLINTFFIFTWFFHVYISFLIFSIHFVDFWFISFFTTKMGLSFLSIVLLKKQCSMLNEKQLLNNYNESRLIYSKEQLISHSAEQWAHLEVKKK